MLLSQKAFERGRQFVEEKGRPLEIARLHFHFDRVPAREVLAELEKFQNADGGFGHALEPDLRAPESSALGSSIAFQILREIGREATDEVATNNGVVNRELRDTGAGTGASQATTGASKNMASTAIRYLLHSFDNKKLRWRIIPPEAEKSPHAPWWTQAGLEKSFNAFWLNPTAELLGYLFDYRQAVPEALLSLLSDEILLRLGTLNKVEMHDFLCCKRLAETESLETSFKARLLDHLIRLLDSTVSKDPAEWGKYGLRPLQVADRPQSPFFEALREVIGENLDYEISTQQADGSWTPPWSWGGRYPDTWERAKLDWAGVLTVEKLLTFKRYERIEGWE